MQKQVLLVEDDRMLAEMYQEKLSMDGFQVIVAEDGEAGLKLARKQPPALILLDIMMPGINGFEVLKALKDGKRTQKIPVIILTNVGNEVANEDTNLALSLGATSYLVKSYHTPDEVVKRVKATLSDQ